MELPLGPWHAKQTSAFGRIASNAAVSVCPKAHTLDTKCQLCGTMTCRIGSHLKNHHYKCPHCLQWHAHQKSHISTFCDACGVTECGDQAAAAHEKKECQLCRQMVCKKAMGQHRKVQHYQCPACNKWSDELRNHPGGGDLCQTCEVPVCRITLSRHFKDSPLCAPTSSNNIAAGKPLYVTVKRIQEDGSTKTYTYPFGILEQQ